MPGSNCTDYTRQLNSGRPLEGFHSRLFGETPEKGLSGVSGPAEGRTDDESLVKVLPAVLGSTFAKLWEGDTTGYDSDSEADLALCGLLASQIGPDQARIERIFNRSDLAKRAKWKDREDYRQSTLRRAIEGLASRTPPLLVRGITSNQNIRSIQENSGTLYTGKGGEGGVQQFEPLTPDLEARAIELAVELAISHGNLPDWQSTFLLARRLRTITGGLGEPFERAVAAYCERAGRPVEEYWYAFLDCWPKVRTAEGDDIFAWAVREAAEHAFPLSNNPGQMYRIVASIAWHLSRHTDPEPFYLPRKRITALLGAKSEMTVSRIVSLLVKDGIIRCVNEEFSYTKRKAKEYMFTGEPPEPA
ncbi:phage NrS-1 polymerase family protein [Tautonia plasticadhaerens]|uniref:NrS-1 polymerase-like HBD domain-containing protein n=1 Tax=Tautonia plasticadhaerens TaxID=2527974 RepID=A0A518HEN1_9BACT|nr:hypothetical protein [Tautonia plasticadhaerens]QDV39310.1 hypothetical protein ElP_72740 [Tautonia plasticadhaerens]